jgi:hypothetical protein
MLQPVYSHSVLGIHWKGGWVDPRTGLEDMQNNLTGTRTRSFGRPARSRVLSASPSPAFRYLVITILAFLFIV